jgi:hypothetical protein
VAELSAQLSAGKTSGFARMLASAQQLGPEVAAMGAWLTRTTFAERLTPQQPHPLRAGLRLDTISHSLPQKRPARPDGTQ